MIVFVLIGVPICIIFIWRYQRKRKAKNVQTNLEQSNQTNEATNDCNKRTEKKKINREVSSVSENLGNIIEKKNSVYRTEKLKDLNEIKELIV